MANKKIAIITPVFPPYGGGIGNVAYNHARLLGQRGQAVTVFTPDYRGNGQLALSACELAARGYRLETVKPVLKYGNAAWVFGLSKKLKNFDAVILNYPFFGGAGEVYKAKKKYNFKLITNYHMDVVGSGFKKIIFNYNTKYFLPRLVKISDIVLASSLDYARNSYLKNYWQDKNQKFQILPIGVDTKIFVSTEGSRFNQQIKKITFIGGLDRAHYFKGVANLIKAVSLLRRSDFEMVIIGKGDLMEDYKTLAKDFEVADKVNFLGGASDAEKINILQNSFLTVLPSIDKSEAFGIVLVESMACGTPVIASDLPGVRCVFKQAETGFVVKPGDVSDLAEKLEYCLDNADKIDKMRDNCIRLTREKYDWEKIIDQLEELVVKN